MPIFYYKALNSEGVIVEGSLESEDAWLARKSLGQTQLKVLKISTFNLRALFKKIEKYWERYQDPVSIEERLVLITQLETGFAVGIPPLTLFDAIQKDIQNPLLKNAIVEIGQDVSQGASLHVAFAKHPRIFDSTFTELLKTGEATGELEKILQRIFKIIEQKAANLAKVNSATLYPKVVVGFMVVVVSITVYYVIPKIKVFLDSIGQDLPLITKFVVGASDFCVHYWFILVALVVGGEWAHQRFLQTPGGQEKLDRLKLRMYIFGSLFLQIELINFCLIFDLLIESGIPIVDSLTILKDSQRNYAVRQEIDNIRSAVVQGSSLYQGLSKSDIFPATFVGLVKIGEESGKIPEVLRRVGKQYQLQVDYKLDNLAKLIEPILLSVIFVMTLILALAIFLPIWKMSSFSKTPH